MGPAGDGLLHLVGRAEHCGDSLVVVGPVRERLGAAYAGVERHGRVKLRVLGGVGFEFAAEPGEIDPQEMGLLDVARSPDGRFSIATRGSGAGQFSISASGKPSAV